MWSPRVFSLSVSEVFICLKFYQLILVHFPASWNLKTTESMLTPMICSSSLSLHTFVFIIFSNILSAAVCVRSIIFFKQRNIADRVCMMESLILLWQTMSLCLLLWRIAAAMQKAVFLIPSSLYVISRAVLTQNLNSLWIATVILTVITLILSVKSVQTFPFFPTLMRQ